MLSELSGFSLTRSIPDHALMGVMTGAYKVYGGVIRAESGQIVAHLLDATNPINLLTSAIQPLDLIISGINTVQLSRIGNNISQLLTLAKGTMALSGLTLGVSAAGFLFLNSKIQKIDERLAVLGKDVKEIRNFLELQERARILTALKTVKSVNHNVDQGIREKVLVNAKQTLGEIHEKYGELLRDVNSPQEALAIEEYYTVTALGQALCAAELDMLDSAHSDLKESYEKWHKNVLRVANEVIIKKNPSRFMEARYVDFLKTDELVDWLEFSNNSEKGIGWIDDLRGEASWMPKIRRGIDNDERVQIEFMRKVVARNRVYKGYISQYEYLAEIKQKPSNILNYIHTIPDGENIEGCFVLISNEFLGAA